MKRILGVSSGCFLHRGNGYVAPLPIPEELKSCWFELQVERGYSFEDFEKIVSIHLPFREYHPVIRDGNRIFLEGRSINIATLDSSLRRRWLSSFKNVLSDAASRGVLAAVLHYGGCDCNGSARLDEKHRLLHWEAEKSFLKELSRHCENLGVLLLVENHPYDDSIFLSHFKHVVSIINEGLAAFCLDLPHAYYREVKMGDVSLKEYVRRLKNHILEVHLADNNGVDHAPLPLGEGHIDFNFVFNSLTKTRFFIVELRENPAYSIKVAEKYMKKAKEG
ncbi:MAG: sugar phosphate isomerase/epimerase family protein [Candidatus Freyarchaeota archaeon]|nr:sugar phosphate isomerase/epimerase [Candidatus Freyrarchaeum guaymaensis]